MKTRKENEDDDENCYWRIEMLRLLSTLTPGLLALCHLGVAQAAAQAALPGTSANEINKVASSSLDETAAKKKDPTRKSVLTPEAYSRWRNIEQAILSDDGAWVAYVLVAPFGGREVIVRATTRPVEHRFPAGTVPPSTTLREAFNRLTAGPRAPEFTSDSRHVVFQIYSHGANKRDDQQLGHDDSRRTFSAAGADLGIASLLDGTVKVITNIPSYMVSKGTRPFVAYTRKEPVIAASPRREQVHSSGVLWLLDLESGREVRIGDVNEFAFDKKGLYLTYVATSAEAGRNGVFVRRLADGYVRAVASGPGRYQNVVFDESGERVGFLSDRDHYHEENPHMTLYYADVASGSIHSVVDAGALGDLRIATDKKIEFTHTGNALVFGISTREAEKPVDQTAETGAVFELWHWDGADVPLHRDSVVPKPRPGANIAVAYLNAQRWAPVGDFKASDIILTGDGRYAVGFDESAYRVQKAWGAGAGDIYVIHVESGKSELLRHSYPGRHYFTKKHVQVSPSDRYLLYFEKRSWFSYEFSTRKIRQLTGARLPEARFETEGAIRLRRPADAVGIGGWIRGEDIVLVYDQRDIWKLDLAGKRSPRNLTHGLGRKKNIEFRVADTEFAQAIDPAGSVLLTALDRETMASGVWAVRMDSNAPPHELLMTEKKLRLLAKAKDTGQYLLTQETFAQFPDLWVGRNFQQLTRVSAVNPQQSEYRWGSAELIQFTSSVGLSLKGVLFKPENFDGRQRYPMLVEIYMGTAETVHRHSIPEPVGAAAVNVPTFLSNGFLVFRPDIVPAVPHPGNAALASVTAGVQSLIDRGFVDERRIGLVGHSYGGYETNYIIGQTDMFRCASAGAGVSNLTSHYGYNPHLYETGLGFIGASISEEPLVYIENSPLFFAQRVTTPLLLLHNDGETTVPFEQGVEFFMALRRNGRQVHMINYKGEDHYLLKQENIDDWTRRFTEFFNHCLKDEPMPMWMRKHNRVGAVRQGGFKDGN